MNKYIKDILLAGVLMLGLTFTACSDRDDVIESLDFDRLFSPVALKASIINLNTMELSWGEVKGADKYVVEIYSDSLQFLPENLVVRETLSETTLIYILSGDMQYSVQVKATSPEVKESKWNTIVFKTGVIDAFLAHIKGDVKAKSVTMRWEAGISAAKINFKPKDGVSVSHSLTAEELAAGIYTMPDLLPNTEYVVTLFDGERRISQRTVVTPMDGATIVAPTDDLVQMIADAEDGDAFLLEAGEYFVGGHVLKLTKKVFLAAADDNNRPVVHAQFAISNSVDTVSVKGLILDGTSSEGYLDFPVQIAEAGTFGKVLIDNCDIKNYKKSLMSASSLAFSLDMLSFNNCIVTNIIGDGGDGIDVRAGIVRRLSITNSTFNNVVPARDFVRFDDASSSYSGETTRITIDKCTFYKVSNAKDKRILYVRFVANQSNVTNSIFASILGYYTNQSKTVEPICSKNNYFEAPAFLAGGTDIAGAKFDTSGSHTTLDPGFKNAANGDFTVSNTALGGIGDPRWFK